MAHRSAAKQKRRARRKKNPAGIPLFFPWRARLEGAAYYQCSRFATHHRHLFRWSAALCGRIQYWYHKITGAPLYPRR